MQPQYGGHHGVTRPGRFPEVRQRTGTSEGGVQSSLMDGVGADLLGTRDSGVCHPPLLQSPCYLAEGSFELCSLTRALGHPHSAFYIFQILQERGSRM